MSYAVLLLACLSEIDKHVETNSRFAEKTIDVNVLQL